MKSPPLPRLVSSATKASWELLSAALLVTAPTEQPQPGSVRRRRIVVALTLVVGAVLLAFSLSTAAGSGAFYPLTAALAATWVIGGFASGPLHLGRIRLLGVARRPVLTGLALGLIAAAVFVVGGLVVREISPLRALIDDVLAHARKGSLPLVAGVTVANGIAEEIFFRGALYSAVGRRHAVLRTSVIYALVTLASGNLMLTFAAVTLGPVFALERRASGGVLSATITHVTWSVIMLLALPPLFH